MEAKHRFHFKMVMVGDNDVGKTSLLSCFTGRTYTECNISGAVWTKYLDLDNGDGTAKLVLWDTCGGERFNALPPYFYRGTDGLVFVYDVTNMASFEHVKEWRRKSQQYRREGMPKQILVGNKVDLEADRVVSLKTAQALADELGVPYLETSAKEDANVTQAFTTLVHAILEATKSNPALMEEQQRRLDLYAKGPKRSASDSRRSLCHCL